MWVDFFSKVCTVCFWIFIANGAMWAALNLILCRVSGKRIGNSRGFPTSLMLELAVISTLLLAVLNARQASGWLQMQTLISLVVCLNLFGARNRPA